MDKSNKMLTIVPPRRLRLRADDPPTLHKMDVSEKEIQAASKQSEATVRLG
jgi:hypothetical protein